MPTMLGLLGFLMILVRISLSKSELLFTMLLWDSSIRASVYGLLLIGFLRVVAGLILA